MTTTKLSSAPLEHQNRVPTAWDVIHDRARDGWVDMLLVTTQGSVYHGSFIFWGTRSDCRCTSHSGRSACTQPQVSGPSKRRWMTRPQRTNWKKVGCRGHGFGNPHVRTYLLIVSESPITQRCRFGRVMATNPVILISTSSPQRPSAAAILHACHIKNMA